MGDPAGIGGELTIRAWLDRGRGTPAFVALDDPGRLAALSHSLGLTAAIRVVDSVADTAEVFPRALPVLPVELPTASVPGKPDPGNAKAILESIERSVALARSGDVGAVVTNPIHKASLYGTGFRFPGHTEYLGHLTGLADEPVMMLAGPHLKVVPITTHLPLRAALDAVTTDRIVYTAAVTDAALRRDFGITAPRLAIAGVNPHAGEGGTLGREEIEVVAPAIERLAGAGIEASGPCSPDAMFHEAARQRYDAAICMYHDQALIPIKTLDFDHGVNVTLGLPIVRTSPDHGTAFDIAGTGTASATSLIASLRLAAEVAARRRAHEDRS